ncbi:MAG: hypothetical protein L0Y58_18775, partial [Verrucomicrobia subdivision 3 bacterium]|nr:hypothetical protein [Limisphaerales bacterium]
SGDYVYISDVWFGVQVIDVSDPTNPRLAGANKLFAANESIVSGDKVVVAGGIEGLVILNSFAPLSGPAISLSAQWRHSMNSLELSLQGLSGLPVQIQRSSDLLGWQSWTNVILGGDPITLSDPSPVQSSQFYRAVAH